jgi:hypothetical protein
MRVPVGWPTYSRTWTPASAPSERLTRPTRTANRRGSPAVRPDARDGARRKLHNSRRIAQFRFLNSVRFGQLSALLRGELKQGQQVRAFAAAGSGYRKERRGCRCCATDKFAGGRKRGGPFDRNWRAVGTRLTRSGSLASRKECGRMPRGPSRKELLRRASITTHGTNWKKSTKLKMRATFRRASVSLLLAG